MVEKFGSFLFISVISVISVFSQPELEYKRIQAKYPGVPVVVIKNNETVNIDIIKGKLSIDSEVYMERMYMDSRAGFYSEQSVSFSHFHNLGNIKAATLIPQKNKYKEIKIKEFKTSDRLSKSVFYDGAQNISFFYPSLQASTKSYLKYQEKLVEPRFISTFFFQAYAPTIESEYSITAANDVELDWKLFNNNDTLVTFSKTSQKGNKTTYTWRIKDIGKYESEDDAPDIRYSMPHLIAWIKSYKVDGNSVPLLRNTNDLYNWYYNITKDVNKEHGKELELIVDSLTSGLSNEVDKVKKIYYWVQDNIKYIAIEDGMGGFVPRSAKSVCEKRYGDCKDMASIINTMLSYAGIPSYITWIGSRDIPYSYSEISTPAVDNHMIVTYINDGNYYFLDATGQYTPYNLPTAFIQGKEALIAIDSANFEVKRVPVIHYNENQIIDSAEVKITDNKISGIGKSYFSGYYYVSLSEMIGRNKLKEPAKLLRDYYSKGSNKFLLDSINIGDINNRDEALKINYSFNIQDYVKHNKDEIYINLHLNKIFLTDEVKKDRKRDIEKRYNGLSTNVITLHIPEGYEPFYIPENTSYSDERFGFDAHYTYTKNSVTLTHKIYSNVLLLKKSDFDDWNAMINELQKTYSESVILKKSIENL